MEKLWTSKQVADFLNVSQSWVTRQVKHKKLDAVQIAGDKRKTYRFSPEYIRERFGTKNGHSAS